MPRNVRNFWLTIDVDGRKTPVRTGPIRKDGGFNITILVRDRGGISSDPVTVRGTVQDGRLIVTASDRTSGVPMVMSDTNRD